MPDTAPSVLTALPMSEASSSFAATPRPTAPLSRCCDREPLPISKLPPLQPPSESFQAFGAKFSWSNVSRSHVGSPDRTWNGSPDDAPDTASEFASASVPESVFSSTIVSSPDAALIAASPVVEPAKPAIVAPRVPASVPQTTNTGGTVSKAGGAIGGAMTGNTPGNMPAPRSRRRRSTTTTGLAALLQRLSQRPLSQTLLQISWPVSRCISQLTSWQPARSALVVYAASLGLGLLAFGLVPQGRDRAIVPLAGTDCAVQADATLTPEVLAQLPSKVGQTRTAIVEWLDTPHCSLPKISVRYGAIVERDVYRLSDDRRVVVSYEDGVLLGIGVEMSPAQPTPRQADVSAPKADTTQPPETNTSEPQHQQEIQVQQSWGVQIGDRVGSASVVGSLGDVSLAHQGRVFAPVSGWVEGNFVLVVGDELLVNEPDCILFSSPQLPAYLMKACGLVQRYLGAVEAGQPIGRTGGTLHVSLLSRQRETDALAATDTGEAVWIYVSPSPKFLALAIEEGE